MTHPWGNPAFPPFEHKWDKIDAPTKWHGPPQSPPLPEVSPYDYQFYFQYQEALHDAHIERNRQASLAQYHLHQARVRETQAALLLLLDD